VAEKDVGIIGKKRGEEGVKGRYCRVGEAVQIFKIQRLWP